ncbi:Thymidylate kinase [Coccidioides posadasii str. Silveira]|uniref:Thymidylate kinase n=3 Tax=Coccidioides posadasii TaxID=199306 RepID=E9DBA7_COCPS|nr:thymidylate kinase, putative [Coccidioides posadasii C735 delta SOWgp]EER27690.1 thymidylate kinase, putative [Coccidioides posadasii C735 delta SOWgp]EFW16059.1 thymidylate kinase [Coccidioides posadasii str. Silveira]KMM67591.1 thymidylate kinase [Coccidioides posadasii RMSCC 3488]QVM11567.1 Thymidylate kinase [Coccidioides posadasii str. Silveira]|eukprot:XP_003069835.1 thymidylate kinase, putative [Coccidioides posadasii C735 delta SOWgp]
MSSDAAVAHADRKMARGALIVIEGLDRAGKSTQCAILVDKLREKGHETKYIRFPDRTTSIGKIIDGYLRGETQLDDHAIHLLFSANRWELASQIRQDISNGISIVIDRYSYSGAVYSAAKNNRELSLEWAWQSEIGLPRPDLWFFLNISPEKAESRGGYGLERYENVTLQLRVGELFKSMQGMENNEEMRIIDANQSKEQVARDISAQVLAAVDSIEGPLRQLGHMPF